MARLNRIQGIKSLVDRTRRRLRDIALWRAFWPLIALVSIFLIAALLGVFERAPKQVAAFAAIVVFAGSLIALLRGLRRFEAPARDDAIHALDAQDELRPLASLLDRPSRPNGDAVALWRAHETRLTDAARRLKVPGFKSIWRRIDPAFLRWVLPAALVTLVALNGTQTHSRLASALTPDYGSLFGAENVQVEVWITPPAYSGRAPIFLKDGQTEARVPRGSVMTLRAQAPSAPKLRLDNDDGRESTRFAATPDGAFETEASIEADTTVSVRWWGERQRWSILASPDDPPTATFVEVPRLGENDRTEFKWAVTDDYGVERLEFSIRPIAEPARTPDRVEIDMGTVSPKEADDDAAVDFTRNRWAGARVEVRLVATDGAGQVGISEPHELILPQKLLLQPLAKAVQDIRVTVLREDNLYAEADPAEDALESGAYFVSATQRIARAPKGIQRGLIMLDAVTYEAPRYFEDILIYSGLRSAQASLAAASSTDEAKSIEPLLWSVALRAEYGTSADALAALQAAKKALEDALRDGASEEEIARLMQAFKDAAQRYVAAKMAEALANGLDAPPDNRDGMQQGGEGLGGQDFSDMLDALEDLTETGASDQARQLLSDITNMLENLEFQQGNGSGSGFPGMPGEPGQGDEDLPQEEREMTETMRELSELLRQQRELNDETLAEQRGERGGDRGQFGGEMRERDGEFSDESGTPDRPGFMEGEGEDERSLAERQDELGDLVEELARRNGEAGGGDESEDGETGLGGLLDEDLLESIERAQRRAGSALEDGNEARSLRNQEQATRQLRELAEGLAEDLDRARAARLGEEEFREGEFSSDPFGRSVNGGIDDSDSVDIPDAAERQRAKDILDELRRRYGDTLDEDERDYLERLLDRF